MIRFENNQKPKQSFRYLDIVAKEEHYRSLLHAFIKIN